MNINRFKVRTVLKADGAKTDKLERLMWRMFAFSVLYLAPAFAFVACLVYEHVGILILYRLNDKFFFQSSMIIYLISFQVHLPKWTQMWQEDGCRDAHFK